MFAVCSQQVQDVALDGRFVRFANKQKTEEMNIKKRTFICLDRRESETKNFINKVK